LFARAPLLPSPHSLLLSSSWCGDHPHLPSFPTRRSSDLADELLDNLDRMDGWPDSVKTMQRNWIGRSEGVELSFEVPGSEEPLSDRKSTRLNSSHVKSSYAVFCLKKKRQDFLGRE